MSARAAKVDSVGGQGTLFETERGYYWVEHDALDAMDFKAGDFGSAEKLHEFYQANSDRVVMWPDSTVKNGQQKAQIWMELVSETHPDELPVAYDLLEADYADRRNPRVPTSIAMQGKARMAAYLFVHGVSKTTISHALDVSPNTVTQYISDVKRGKR